MTPDPNPNLTLTLTLTLTPTLTLTLTPGSMSIFIATLVAARDPEAFGLIVHGR